MLVASDTSDIARTISNLGAVVALSGVGVVLLAAIAAAVLTRRGLRPLRRLAAAAGEIERTADPSQRLPEPAALDEIGQLTGVLNRMLSSLEQARASERRFLADASHELRTPVTSLLGNVEYAVRHGAEPEVLEDLRQDAARLARLVDALLALERAAGAPPADEPVALDELVREVAAGHDPARTRGDAGAGDGQRGRRRAPPGDRQPDRERTRPRSAGGPVTVSAAPPAGEWARAGGHRRGPGPRCGPARAPVRALLARARGLRAPRLGARTVDRGRDRRPSRG